jgi:flagellar assembly factor FliW
MSSLTIESSRFGRVHVDPATVIEFPEGLIGIAGSRFALLATDAQTPFMWMQSLDDPALALPVTQPGRFFDGFKLELSDEEGERLGLDERTPVTVYVTVTASAALEDFTANLKAPIIVHEGKAHQVINQAEGAALRAPLFPRPGGRPEPAPAVA